MKNYIVGKQSVQSKDLKSKASTRETPMKRLPQAEEKEQHNKQTPHTQETEDKVHSD